MNYDDTLVGSVAMVMAALSFSFAIGPWDQPYELRTIAAVRDRYGKLIARGIWIAIAMATLCAGLAIFSGARPSYAVPQATSQP